MAHPDPPQPRRRANPLLIGCLGLLGLGIGLVGFAGCGVFVAIGAGHKNTGDGPARAVKQAMNQPTSDGTFTFVVTGTERTDHVGDSTFGMGAQGQFLLVHVRVTNRGDRAQPFSASDQKLLADGAVYDADSAAAIYIADSDTLLDEIKPGNSVDAVVPFDVPKGTTPTEIVLHESAFSSGATVTLSGGEEISAVQPQ